VHEEAVRQMIENPEESALSPAEKALFRFLARLNAEPHTTAAADAAALREAGWTDEQIYYAATVCALFNFYNRWVDGTGVHAMSGHAHREAGRRSAAHGYVRK